METLSLFESAEFLAAERGTSEASGAGGHVAEAPAPLAGIQEWWAEMVLECRRVRAGGGDVFAFVGGLLVEYALANDADDGAVRFWARSICEATFDDRVM